MPQEILPPLTDTAISDPAAPDTSSEEPFVADPDDLPPELAFDPVPQQTKRWAGINAHKQRLFVAHLAATGSVAMAAKAAGHSTSAFYLLRKRESAAGFAAAWDRAVETGALRVADLLMEYAIHGVPETLSKEGRVILERRRPNLRAMQLIAATRFPERFGGINPVDCAGTAVPHAVRRLREKWRAEWEAERQAKLLEHNAVARRQGTGLDDRLRVIRTGFQRKIAHDPVKRAAWDLLTGPGTDWDAVIRADAYANPQKHEWHMFHPDMIVPLAAGAGNLDWEAEEGRKDLSLAPWHEPAEDPDGSTGQSDEIWFERYQGHIAEREPGEHEAGQHEAEQENAHTADDGDAPRGENGGEDGGEKGDEGAPDPRTVTRAELRAAAHELRTRAGGWQQARKPVIQHPHGFLTEPRLTAGPTIDDRNTARHRIEQTIAELEREWNAAYSEESWAAWQAGRAAEAAGTTEAADAKQPQAERGA